MGMNINLTPQLEDLVRQKVASGLYTSASEVVREALRLMDEKDRLLSAKLEQLRQDIREVRRRRGIRRRLSTLGECASRPRKPPPARRCRELFAALRPAQI
jgi:putative addiction module CopG family antidote